MCIRDRPRTYFMKDGVLQLPASVTPIVRFPLFWLAYHNLPATLYRKLALWTWKEDGYFLTYFHPWEFTSLSCLLYTSYYTQFIDIIIEYFHGCSQGQRGTRGHGPGVSGPDDHHFRRGYARDTA